MPRLRMDKIIVWVDVKQICVEFETLMLNDNHLMIIEPAFFASWMLSEQIESIILSICLI